MPNQKTEAFSEAEAIKTGSKASVHEMKTSYPKEERDFVNQYTKVEGEHKCKKVKFKWLY